MPDTPEGFFIRQLPQVTKTSDLLGKKFELEGPLNGGVPTPGHVDYALLVQGIHENAPGANNAKSLYKVVRTYSPATPEYLNGDQTLTQLNPLFLALGCICFVEFPLPSREYRLVYAADSPLVVWKGGNFAGEKLPAKWVEKDSLDEYIALNHIEPFDPLKASYPTGKTVSFSINNTPGLYNAKVDLVRSSFPGNAIPAPTGTADDPYWQAQVLNTGGGGGAEDPYTLNVTETIGGLTPGIYTGTDKFFITKMAVKYQSPSLNDSLQVAGQSSQTVEVGTSFPAGFKSITWSTSNGANVKPNSITFRDVTANTILNSNEANDGTLSASTAAFTVTKGTSRVYLLSGVDTQNNTFFDDVTISGLFKSYFGYFASKTLTLAQILNLGNGQLQNGHKRTVGGVTAGAGLYTVYAWEDNNSNDDVAQVLQDGVDSIRGAFGGVQRATGPNALGVTVTMAYIVSNATQAFTNSTLEFK
jgi:hypothetical protein